LARVMVSLKIFPSDIVADMNGLKETIKESLEGKATIYKFDEEPVAFGLIALIVHILIRRSLGDHGRSRTTAKVDRRNKRSRSPRLPQNRLT